jgi:hypothetical protein
MNLVAALRWTPSRSRPNYAIERPIKSVWAYNGPRVLSVDYSLVKSWARPIGDAKARAMLSIRPTYARPSGTGPPYGDGTTSAGERPGSIINERHRPRALAAVAELDLEFDPQALADFLL